MLASTQENIKDLSVVVNEKNIFLDETDISIEDKITNI